MKQRSKIYGLLICLVLWGCSNDDDKSKSDDLQLQAMSFADFETYNGTPYYFRYGNQNKSGVQGGIKVVSFYPRWAYSYTVVDNPLRNDENSSGKVLEYISLEARNFGVKFCFPEVLKKQSVRKISFQIYQPTNVIGKETWDREPKATSQQLGVKLLSRFNGVNDCIQEEGILLTKSIVDFEEEGEWKTYTFTFSEDEYPSAASGLSNGIVGLVIMPTYNSKTTLAEKNIYKCYIDHIQIYNKEGV